MTTAPNRCPAASTPPFSLAVEYDLSGDLRYLSHHDELRMLARAVTRAAWPVAYSQGFSPRPRIRLPLPRSVGMAARPQLALIDLRARPDPRELYASLARQLPPPCALRAVTPLVGRPTPHARRVSYELSLAPQHAAIARSKVADLLAATTLRVERRSAPHRPQVSVDLRPFVETVEVVGDVLRVQLVVDAQRTARMAEILTKLSLPADAYNHRVCRTQVQWDIDLAGPPRPAATERNELDRPNQARPPSIATAAQDHRPIGLPAPAGR